MKVNVGVSNRHIHLSRKDYDYLFGSQELLSIRDLSQSGEFASNLTLSIKTEKGTINNVRVVGPLREKTQIEISKTDARYLGINPPVRMSGELSNSERVILVNGNRKLETDGCILAHRHIHINKEECEKYGLKDREVVSVKVSGERGGILDNVMVKCKDSYNFEFHVDTDEANAFLLSNNDTVEIIKGNSDE